MSLSRTDWSREEEMGLWVFGTTILASGLATVAFTVHALGQLISGYYEYAWYSTLAALVFFAVFRLALHLLTPHIELGEQSPDK